MRDINANFTTEKNAETNSPIHLYTIFDYDGVGNNLYYAEDKAQVTFDGQAYSPFPITYEHISEQSKGQIDSVEIRTSNVNRIVQSYLEQYDLRNKKISIKTVWRDQLADADAFIEDIYYIDSYTADEYSVVFLCTSKLDILNRQIPGRTYSRNACPFIFKDTETCQYVGAESTCNKTKQQCQDYGNLIHFGGFPSIPSRRVNRV